MQACTTYHFTQCLLCTYYYASPSFATIMLNVNITFRCEHGQSVAVPSRKDRHRFMPKSVFYLGRRRIFSNLSPPPFQTEKATTEQKSRIVCMYFVLRANGSRPSHFVIVIAHFATKCDNTLCLIFYHFKLKVHKINFYLKA